MDINRGYYRKYIVIRSDEAEEVAPGLFQGKCVEGKSITLFPERDPAAVAALQKYAEVTPNRQFAEDIMKMLE